MSNETIYLYIADVYVNIQDCYFFGAGSALESVTPNFNCCRIRKSLVAGEFKSSF